MSKIVGVTNEIYELVRVLEVNKDSIEFSVFYSFAEILKSHHFCPGFYCKGNYYEVQYDDGYTLQVVDFGFKGMYENGTTLNGEEISELTKKLEQRELLIELMNEDEK